MKTVTVGNVSICNDIGYCLIGGPCQLESLDHALMLAEIIATAAEVAGVPLISKASYDKANRTSISGKRGVGMDEGLKILAAVKDQFHCPVLTDVHEPQHCAAVAEVVDVLQIPAFLSRQTDLLLAAGETGATVNVKKGQFMAPWDMPNVAAKIASTGSEKIMLCERGACFGYNMRALPIMAETGYPLARAALAVGAAAIFIETHEDPDNASSDGPNMVPIQELPQMLLRLKAIDDVRKVF